MPEVRVWHRRFGHASNARIVRASKLLTGMRNFNNAYDPTEVYSNSEQSEFEHESDHNDEAEASLLAPLPDNDFDSICTPCIASKQTRVVIRDKPMTEASEKLEEVHVDLWGPHYPLSLVQAMNDLEIAVSMADVCLPVANSAPIKGLPIFDGFEGCATKGCPYLTPYWRPSLQLKSHWSQERLSNAPEKRLAGINGFVAGTRWTVVCVKKDRVQFMWRGYS